MPANTTAVTNNTDDAVNNVSSSARINQMGERLFTVRPRHYTGLSESTARGQVGSIRVVRSLARTKEEEESYASTMKGFERKAYQKFIDTKGYNDFLIQSIQYSIQEKSQVFHSFGGNHSVYFYGENPVVFTINGLVTDDLDNDQYARFMALYQNHLRGTEASRDFSLLEISLPNLTIFGSCLGISVQQQADRDTDIGFSIQILAKSYVFRSTDEFYKKNKDSNEINDYQSTNFLTSSPSQVALVERFKTYKAAMDANTTASLRTAMSENVFDPNGFSLSALGLYTSGVDVPDSIKDVMSTVDDAFNWINGVSNTIRSYASFVTGYANLASTIADTAVSYLGRIEDTLDNLMNTVGGVISSVTNAIERIEDAFGTIINFPESIAIKIGRFLENGLIPPEGVSLIGSRYVSSEDAERLLKMQARTTAGPARGTAKDPAITTDADDMATLTYS